MKKLMFVAFGIPQLMSINERKRADLFLEFIRNHFGDLYRIEESFPLLTRNGSYEWRSKTRRPLDVFVGAFISRPTKQIQYELGRSQGSSKTAVMIFRGFEPTSGTLNISNISIGMDSGSSPYSFQDLPFFDFVSALHRLNHFLIVKSLPRLPT